MWKLGNAGVALRSGMAPNRGERRIDCRGEAAASERKESNVGPRLCGHDQSKPLHQAACDYNASALGCDDVQQPDELLGNSGVATRCDVIDQ